MSVRHGAMVTDRAPADHGLNGEVMSLCRALRQFIDALHLEPEDRNHLVDRLAVAEASAHGSSSDAAELIQAVKVIRYVLLESADGPLVPFLADAAATIIG